MCTRDENLAFDLKSEDNNPELTPNLAFKMFPFRASENVYLVLLSGIF